MAAVFLVLVVSMLALVGLRNPGQALLGIGVVLAGAPVFSIAARRKY